MPRFVRSGVGGTPAQNAPKLAGGPALRNFLTWGRAFVTDSCYKGYIAKTCACAFTTVGVIRRVQTGSMQRC
jgi:hypothetical protein